MVSFRVGLAAAFWVGFFFTKFFFTVRELWETQITPGAGALSNLACLIVEGKVG
jgi:hypothetical protein